MPLLGGPRRPQRKPRARCSVEAGARRAAPAAPGAALLGQRARGVVSFPLRTSRGRAYDSHHRTAGIAGCTRRRGSRVAARGARTAGGESHAALDDPLLA